MRPHARARGKPCYIWHGFPTQPQLLLFFWLRRRNLMPYLHIRVQRHASSVRVEPHAKGLLRDRRFRSILRCARIRGSMSEPHPLIDIPPLPKARPSPRLACTSVALPLVQLPD
ncbi:hypothetical protein BAUCODRAFT_448962 [Baudoinia panamericana UAMH 10762]|uniref:Uncharacterized protein n=1 Tax=Baudoinia panamericana (strain UAMH 10762) TaxID=717646 RepID=M2MKY4_BAUPA|nr:uncharacterized protein BAUCODRAFT_448962 [Baudoinia panamericana UAMH 10762]EMC97351.1 hypothetical protein BAUCODRAFT_448962 [Baudoinia panamericana UAMH 10762]